MCMFAIDLSANFRLNKLLESNNLDGFDENEMGRIHFQLDLTSNADNRQIELGRKAVALYNVYFTNMSSALNSFDELIDDILDDKRKVITDYDLFLQKSVPIPDNVHVSKMHDLPEPKSSNFDAQSSPTSGTITSSVITPTTKTIPSKENIPISVIDQSSGLSPSSETCSSSKTPTSSETCSSSEKPQSSEAMNANQVPTLKSLGETMATPLLVGGGPTVIEMHRDIFNDGSWPPGTVVMPGTTLGKRLIVGNDVFIRDGVTIGDNVTISEDVEILSGMNVQPNTFVIGKMDTNLILDMMDDFKTISEMDDDTVNAKVDVLLHSGAE